MHQQQQQQQQQPLEDRNGSNTRGMEEVVEKTIDNGKRPLDCRNGDDDDDGRKPAAAGADRINGEHHPIGSDTPSNKKIRHI